MKSFSGKLPFRTQPDLHESIYLAAQKAGKSINAWMEEKMREAVKQDQNAESQETPASPSLQQLFQEKPDVIFDLIDRIKPELKSSKTRDTVFFISEVEQLMVNYELVQSQISADRPDADRLIEATLPPFLHQTESIDPPVGESLDISVAVVDSLRRVDETLSATLRQADREQLIACTRAIGQILISVAAIRHYLKDSSIENTLNVVQQIIHHFLT